MLIYLARFGIYESSFGLNQVKFLFSLDWLWELIRLSIPRTNFLGFLWLDVRHKELSRTQHFWLLPFYPSDFYQSDLVSISFRPQHVHHKLFGAF